MGGFTLADRLGAKPVNCRVRGCKRTWMEFSAKSGLSRADDDSKGLCEPCAKKLPRLKDQELPCPRPGCPNHTAWSREEQLEYFAQQKPPPRQLCQPCHDQLNGLEEKQVGCAVPGCENQATLTPKQQLLVMPLPGATVPVAAEASATEAAPSAQGEAPAAATDAQAAGDEEEAHDGRIDIEGALCKRCSDVIPRLRNREVGCGINQCRRTWTWTSAEQMAVFVSGGANEPPRRMCLKCRSDFAGLVERQVRCRASGCKNHWTWTREDQLDACSADKKPGKPPAHLCERCFTLWAALKDVERPCRKSGCKNTWSDKRGAQLARAIRGKTGDPYPQYCSEHGHLVDQLADREIQCTTVGCEKTWKWTRNQQLAAGVQPEPPADEDQIEEATQAPRAPIVQVVGAPINAPVAADGAGDGTVGVTAQADGALPERAAQAEAAPAAATQAPRRKAKGRKRRQPKPPSKHCHRCSDFLSSHKTIELPCAQCGTPIFWPPESQLQSELGHWEIPKMCGACKRDATEAERQRQREQLRQNPNIPGRTPPSAGAGSATSAEAAPAPTPASEPAPEAPSEGTAAAPDSASE